MDILWDLPVLHLFPPCYCLRKSSIRVDPALNMAEFPLKSLCFACVKSMLCLFMVTFQCRVFFSFISESKQLLFESSDLLHNFTTAPESFAVGITEKNTLRNANVQKSNGSPAALC